MTAPPKARTMTPLRPASVHRSRKAVRLPSGASRRIASPQGGRPVRTDVASVWVGSFAAAALLCAAPAQAAPAPAASVWTLMQDGGERQCRLTLRPAADGKGAPVAMPVGCRRAFPALNGVAFWSEAGDGLHLDDARGEPLLAFDADGAGFRTVSPQGDHLALKPADGRGRAALDRAAAAMPAPVATAAVATAAVELAQASAKPAPASRKAATAGPKPAEVAGRYAVLRDKTRDTGCMVTLDDKTAGPGKTLKARLAPACRDQGIVIFDPVGWEVAGGKLVLTARKGHTTELDTQEDGSWMNDPKKGKALSLKRI